MALAGPSGAKSRILCRARVFSPPLSLEDTYAPKGCGLWFGPALQAREFNSVTLSAIPLG